MLDRFDYRLLEEVQRDDSRTSDQLSAIVPLSPSAIARRLRRLRGQGWIARSIGLIDARLTRDRLRAMVAIELAEHANPEGKGRLVGRLFHTEQVQFAYEVTGTADLVTLFDCRNMEEFNLLTMRLFDEDPIVRRYVTSFVKRPIKFAPFVGFDERGE